MNRQCNAIQKAKTLIIINYLIVNHETHYRLAYTLMCRHPSLNQNPVHYTDSFQLRQKSLITRNVEFAAAFVLFFFHDKNTLSIFLHTFTSIEICDTFIQCIKILIFKSYNLNGEKFRREWYYTIYKWANVWQLLERHWHWKWLA